VTLDYLEKEREYFIKFSSGHYEKYIEVQKYYRVGGGTGYQHFFNSHFVVQTIDDIVGNLYEFYGDVSIPERFPTPQGLIESWFRFKEYLEERGEQFNEIEEHLKQEHQLMHGDSDDPYSYLPEPFIKINSVRLETLDAINHLLNLIKQKPLDNGLFNADIMLVERICRKFPTFVKQLKNRHANRGTIDVNDEYDVQDLLHSILKLHFDDVRAEDYASSRAGANSRVDFVLGNEHIVLEVKMTRLGLNDKVVGEQLIVDIERYRTHPKCKTLICFVYDPNSLLSNPTALENDLSRDSESLTVKVIVSPTV
ncbi:hypothetical protein ACQSN4_004799, partial [Vibrio parahaemolyticus]